MNHSSFGGSPFAQRGSPFAQRGSPYSQRGSPYSQRGSPYSPRASPYTPRGGSGGHRGRANRFSPLVSPSVPNFTPSPRGGRGRWSSPRGGGGFTPRGRGGFTPRGGGGGGGLCFDETFVRFATENPWAELERCAGLAPALGPLNTGAAPAPQDAQRGDSRPPTEQRDVPMPAHDDDDDDFV